MKNTFIHFDDPSTPVPAPPTFSVPGTLLDCRFRTLEPMPLKEESATLLEQPAKGRRRDILRRMFGGPSRRAAAEDQWPAEAAMSPVKLQLKNTFVHLEEP